MKVLIILGHWMKVTDSSALIALAAQLEALGHEVRVRECLQSGSPENVVTLADVVWAEAAITYSFGTSSYWILTDKKQLPKKLLVIVAGVADELRNQYKPFLWHATPETDRAICFDVRDVPTSSTLLNIDAVSITIDQPIPPNARCVNVRCDGLFPAIMLPGAKHIAIKEQPLVLAAIASLFPPAATRLGTPTNTGASLNPPDAPAPSSDNGAGAHTAPITGATP